MNKSIIILLTLVTLHSLDTRTETAIGTSISKAGSYLLSKKDAQDLALAYCLSFGMTCCHELGHAITKKILIGSPINILLGTNNDNPKSYIKIGGITLGGFNPIHGYALGTTGISYLGNSNLHLKNIAVYAAGPIFGGLSSLATLLLLQQYNGLYITKYVGGLCLFINTFGQIIIAPMPESDVYKIIQEIMMYKNHTIFIHHKTV